MSKIKFVLAIFILLSSQHALAASEKEAAAFFQNYVNLSEDFNVSVKDLYADDAKIHTYRRYPDGLQRAAEMTGKEWKELLEKVMSIAKKKGDISEYKNATFSLDDSKVTIKADRYSTLKCYTDTAYYMVIRKDKSGLKIIEEYSETQPQSDCISKSNRNLKLLLSNAENQIKGYLPLMVDEETRLDAVKITNDTFYYIYTLVKVSPGEFNSNKLTEILKPILLDQSCNTQNLQPLVNAGATIAYKYKNKKGKMITTININRGDCK